MYIHQGKDGTITMYWFKPCVSLPFGDCAMYVDHGQTSPYIIFKSEKKGENMFSGESESYTTEKIT